MIVKEWKIIEKASNYEISNYGEVKNKITNQISKPTLVGGYLSIGLPINNKNVTSFIHRLVATSFLIRLDESFIVNHKDGNKINNNVENLEWISLSENSKHAFRLGLNKPIKIKVSQYTLDNIFIKDFGSLTDAEKETGVSNGSISNVCRGVRKTAGGYIWKYSNYIPIISQTTPDGKSFDGYPNYLVTKDGKIYNSQRKRFLTSSKHTNGYMVVGLSDGKKRNNFSVHRLVALLFLDNPNNYPDVNHKDCDKTHNNMENLEWISHSDNMKHMYKNK